MSGRVLAVDLGEKRIGLAVSDLTRTIANPRGVILHVGRKADAQAVAAKAHENEAVLIVVGQPLNSEGEPGPGARHAARFADELALHTAIPVTLWDESGSTLAARHARIEMGVRRNQRSGHLDDLAATVILQSFLDAHPEIRDLTA